ncbi:MAG: hypothetical protein E7273_09850 [Pseudobutyrivibrio ruminis]|nr:hypothetical protein [Pseudobutyrivibrio ruminis]
MSRVIKPNKYVNSCKYSSEVTNISKMTRLKTEYVNPAKATTLSSWLFLKYDMSYKTFARKSKAKKDELRQEYVNETGNTIKGWTHEDCNTNHRRGYINEDYFIPITNARM